MTENDFMKLVYKYAEWDAEHARACRYDYDDRPSMKEAERLDDEIRAALRAMIADAVSAERERCAKMCDEYASSLPFVPTLSSLSSYMRAMANTIRVRRL